VTVYEAAWRASVLPFLAFVASAVICAVIAVLVSVFVGEAAWKAGAGYPFLALVPTAAVCSYVVTARKFATKAKCQVCGRSNAVLRWGRVSWNGRQLSRPSPECRKCGADLKSMIV